MTWTRVCYAAGALTAAAVLLLPPAAAGRATAEDSASIAGDDDTIEPGQTVNVTVNCDAADVKADVWYSPKGSTDERGKTTVDTGADGKATAKIDLSGKVKAGDYSVSVRCGDTNIVKNDFTVIVAEKTKSPSPSQDKSLTVSPNPVAPGGTITITGWCEAGTKDVAVWYGDADGSGDPAAEKSGITAGSDGKVSQSLVVTDDTRPGSYEAALRCGKDGKSQTADFTVSTGGSTAGDGSAASGDGTMLALIGGGMLAVAALGGAIYMQRRGLGASA